MVASPIGAMAPPALRTPLLPTVSFANLLLFAKYLHAHERDPTAVDRLWATCPLTRGERDVVGAEGPRLLRERASEAK